MQTSNLARRLEEFDADISSLRLTSPTEARFDVPDAFAEPAANPTRRVRRAFRAGAIRNRDQGLRAFRVR